VARTRRKAIVRGYALGWLAAIGLGLMLSRAAVVSGVGGAADADARLAAGRVALTDRPYVGRVAVRDRSYALRAPRIVVVKSTRRLHLFDGERYIKTYRVGLGVGDVGRKRLAGDGCTPEGDFRVVVKKPDGRFGRFLGINYPNRAAINWGLRAGLVSLGEALVLERAIEAGHMPNWTTDLGGGIGIHGGGAGSDWTAGCLALDDADVDELLDVMRVGDPVEVLP